MGKTETITIENRSISIVVNGQVFHSDEVPIVLVFPDDETRVSVAVHLNSMGFKPGIRAYAMMPDELPAKDEVIPNALELYLADLGIADPPGPGMLNGPEDED